MFLVHQSTFEVPSLFLFQGNRTDPMIRNKKVATTTINSVKIKTKKGWLGVDSHVRLKFVVKISVLKVKNQN